MERSEAQKSGRGEVQVKGHRSCAEVVAVAKDRKGGFLRRFSPEPGLLLGAWSDVGKRKARGHR